jgi:tetratricopeptide (TPR) repeat protein
MAVIYGVTVEPTGKENIFRITWHKQGSDIIDSFEGAAEVVSEEIHRFWHQSRYQMDIGRKLFRFLDGEARHLHRALQKAGQQGKPLQLHLYPCNQILDWPFELLVEDSIFLVPHMLHLVWCVSEWTSRKKILPANRPLKLLFMASSPLDVELAFDFEKEEETIFKITENLAINVNVADSGSLESLRRQLEQDRYDVVHLSGHSNIDRKEVPYFIMEDETGHGQRVYPPRLWQEALIENPPRLLILSGSISRKKPGNPGSSELNSFGLKMVESYGVPALMVWGEPITEKETVYAAKVLYHELSRGKSILDTMQRVRLELIKEFPLNAHLAWPWLRLFSSGMSLDAIVTKNQQFRPQPRRMVHAYLKNSQVQVLAEGFVGRRRQFQQCMRTLYHDVDKVGVIILGTAGLGKSCLAGKICERFSDHILIIIHGKLNSITLTNALSEAFIMSRDVETQHILSQKKEMKDILADLCATSFRKKNYLLLLDDFDVNLEGADKGDLGPLLPEAVELLESLLYYLPFSGKMTQIIITNRYPFSLTMQERDLVKERLEWIMLTGFTKSEQMEKARELKNIFDYSDRSLVPQVVAAGHGNPRLMEWIDLLVGQMPDAEVPELLEAIGNKKEEFIRGHVLRELFQREEDDLKLFLRWFSIYRQPVSREGVQKVGEHAGLETWEELLKEGIGLSLVEHDQIFQAYQVTPLLKEELLKGLEHSKTFHEAAFAYYKRECESRKAIEPILWEEWIFHALNCEEEDTALEQGIRLVKHLRERLAFLESRRIGEWILTEKRRKLSTINDAFLLNELAFSIRDLGDYRQAIEYYEQALAILKTVYGEKHQDIADSLSNIGSTWEAFGDYPRAIDYYEQALAIFKKICGEKDSRVADGLNKLGLAWNTLGDSKKTIEYCEQALHIWKEVHGDNHPQVAAGLNNLGLAWNALGDHKKAIEYYEQALSIDRTVYGETHPDIAIDLNNLGSAWEALGDLKRSIDYYEQALSIDRTVFGEEHPNVATRLNNLGSAWDALGDHRRAIEYYEQALVIWEEVYGKMHPQVAAVLNNLGSVYYQIGQKKWAKDYFEKAYEIFNQLFGSNHPHTKAVAQWLTAGTG